jgi:hypothetical protein
MQRGNILHSYYFTVICQTNFTSLTFQTCPMVRVRARAQAIQVDPMAWALPSQARAIRARARALALGSQTCRTCHCRNPTCFPWMTWIPYQTCPMIRVRVRIPNTRHTRAIRARAIRAQVRGSQIFRTCHCRSQTCFPWIPYRTCPMAQARGQATPAHPIPESLRKKCTQRESGL